MLTYSTLKEQTIKFNYKPFIKQAEFHANTDVADISWFICGTGGGKTFAVIVEAIKRACIDGTDWEDSLDDTLPYLGIIIAPTYKLLKMVHWQILLHYIPDDLVKDISKGDFKITLINNAEIMLLSGEDPDRLRSFRPNFIAIDEGRMMDKYVFDLAMNRVTFRKGKVFGATTTYGYDWSYDIENMALKDPKVKVVKGISLDNPLFDPEVIEKAKDRMDEKFWRQEFMATRESYGGACYYNFNRERNVRACLIDPDLPLMFAMDFNVSPMTCAVCQRHGQELWISDEIVINGSNVYEVCREIDRRYRNYFRINKNNLENVIFYPDPSGIAKQHGGMSSFEMIRSFFRETFNTEITINFRRKAPYIQDRINSVNARLLNMRGQVNLFVDQKCVTVIRSFEQTSYKENTQEVDKSKNIEHITDGIGYLCEIEFPIVESKIGVLK